METTSDLPDEIVDDIGRRLHTLEEFVRFGAVCKSWRATTISVQKEFKEKPTSTFSDFSPWMMLASYDDGNDPHKGIQKFYSFSNKRVFNLDSLHSQGRTCWGSPYGWMVTVGNNDNIRLLNPLSHCQFSLPPFSTLEYGIDCSPEDLRLFVAEKFILSAAPSIDQSSIVMVIAMQRDFCLLFIARPGDKAWNLVDTPASEYADAIFYKDQFYAIDCDGELVVCDICTSYPKATKFCSPPEQDMSHCYLVEISGDLVLLERIFYDVEADIWKTKRFKGYKLDFESRIWTELSGLGDNAVFLGNNSSFAISTSEFCITKFELKSNCIYFTGHHFELHSDFEFAMGIYDYCKDTMEPLYEGEDILSEFSLPVFFMPSL